MEVMKEVIKGI